MTKHVALYIRVSTDAQFEEGYSVDAQHDMLEGYCKSKGWKTFEFYIDGGFSGSNIERPEMQRLIKDVQAGQISHVVVYKLDRLSRSQKDTLFLIEDVFNPAGTDFTSLNENLDTGTPMGRAMLGIMSAFAQLERETIRERTRMGMKERVRNGLWMGGGHPPFGYDYDATSGILVPNNDAQVVRLIYDLYLSGESTAVIAEKTGFSQEKQIRDILSRKSYIGIIQYNGNEYIGRHKPIVDRDTYEKVQEMIARRSNARNLKSEHLLTGLIYCGCCGARMRYQKWGKLGYKLTCYSQQTSKRYLIRDKYCSNEKTPAYEAETAVINDFLDRALIRSEKQINENSTAPELNEITEKIKETEHRLKRLYSLYSASDDDILLNSIEEQQKLLETLRNRTKSMVELREQREEKQKRLNEIRTLAEAWDYMTVEEKKNIIREVIERIEIKGCSIDIHYRL